MLLHLAIKEGNVARVKELLEQGYNPDEYHDGQTPLLEAVIQAVMGGISLASCMQIIDALLEKGANINLKGLSGQERSALHWAAEDKDPELILYLLIHGADVHSVTNMGATALHLAVNQMSVEASEESRLESARILVEYGANVNAKTRFSEFTPFTYAKDNPELYSLVFEYGMPNEHAERELALDDLFIVYSSLFIEQKHPLADFSFYKNDQVKSEKSKLIFSKKINPPEAYNHHDIEELQKLSSWTKQTEAIHREYNRVLQPGFMHRDPNEVLADLQLVGVDSLSSFCCPGVRAAMILHLVKELSANYKVEETDLNQVSHALYYRLLKTEDALLGYLQNEIELQLDNRLNTIGEDILYKHAIKLLNSYAINEPDFDQINAAKRLYRDGERTKITNEVMSSTIKGFLAENASYFNLSVKPVYGLAQTEDYCLIGAPGSGKSTLVRLYLNEERKTEFICLATDNYRPITVPSFEAYEEKFTKNALIQTQDMACLIRDLVVSEIARKIKEENCRPNIIVECVNFSSNTIRNFLSQGQTIYIVAAYRGDPGYTGIAERVDQRARDVSASPVDKGRFIGTKTLLNSHANAAHEFINSIPPNTLATIFDTAVAKGHPPVKIASINTKIYTIEIDNLRVMSEFLNKRNININAINQVDLILKKDDPFDLLVTHPEYKAESTLHLIAQSPAFTLMLKENDLIYAELRQDNNSYVLKVTDWDLFMKKSMADTIESSVLRAITRQVLVGGLGNSYEIAYAKGDKEAFQQALEQLIEHNMSESIGYC